MKKHQKYRKNRQQKGILPVMFGAGLILVGLVLFIVLQGTGDAAASEVISRSVVPMAVEFPAPELELENLNGIPESLDDFRGQVVLLNNWATWCPPCKAEMPSLQKYYEAYKDDGFIIVAVSAGDSKVEVEQFAQSYNLTFHIWLDPNGVALNTFRNGSLPNSYVIDRDGTVRYAWTGEISYEMLDKYITPVIQAVN